MQRRKGNVRWLLVLFTVLMGVLLAKTALAAEFASNKIYRLPAGEVLKDDLYIAAAEIYIDGTIQGDLIAAGSYVEISGTVTEDAMIAAAEINVRGTIQDDARLGAAGIMISGKIGGDVLMAAGGGAESVAFPIGGRTVEQGIRLGRSAQVGGDVIVGAGAAIVDGTIAGDLLAGAGSLTLAAEVAGVARLDVERLVVLDAARVAGPLRYTSTEQIAIPEGVAPTIEFVAKAEERAQPQPGNQFLNWLVRTMLIIAGFALLGWLALRFAPGTLVRPARTLAANPGRVVLSGLFIALLFMFLPLASALLVFLMFLFWGWFPGIILFLLLFALLAVIWYLSPLVTGLWLGWQVRRGLKRELNDLTALLVGVVLLVLPGRIPILGWFVYLVSFVLALGALFIARSGQETPPLRVADGG